MKRLVLLSMLLLVPFTALAQETEDLLDKPAAKAAIADAVTTAVALSKGHIEKNPLIGQSQLNNVAALGLKLGLVAIIQTMPDDQKKPLNKIFTGMYGGVAVNNLLVVLGAASGVSIVVGLVSGVYMYQNTDGN